MKLIIDADLCTGCRSCEVICTYHHGRAFGRKKSSIKISKDGKTGLFKIMIVKGGKYSCDLCDGEPLCVKYCAVNAVIKSG